MRSPQATSRRVGTADPRTEVGRLGMALNGMLAQIEAAFGQRKVSEDRLRRFVADASHELRTPLTSIRGYAELFRRGADQRPEDLARSMTAIEAEAARMGVLVDDLLLLARLDQGRPLELEPVDVGVATEAVDAARAVDPDRDVSLEIDGDVEIVGDAGKLRQVVDNLLDNVREHTPTGTPAGVRVAREGDDVTLTVADEGPGSLRRVTCACSSASTETTAPGRGRSVAPASAWRSWPRSPRRTVATFAWTTWMPGQRSPCGCRCVGPHRPLDATLRRWPSRNSWRYPIAPPGAGGCRVATAATPASGS